MEKWVIDDALIDSGYQNLVTLVKNAVSDKEGDEDRFLLVLCLACKACGDLVVQVYVSNDDDGPDLAAYKSCPDWSAKEECEKCDEYGHVEKICAECDGNCTIEHSCEDCDNGHVECNNCCGDKRIHSRCGAKFQDGCSCDHEEHSDDCDDEECDEEGCKLEDCQECDGTMKVDCSTCEGSGNCERSCDTCDGDGNVSCPCDHCDNDMLVAIRCNCGEDIDMNHRTAQVVVARGDVHVDFPPPVVSLKIPLFKSIDLLYNNDTTSPKTDYNRFSQSQLPIPH